MACLPSVCSVAWGRERYGLIWVGEAFYGNPQRFLDEAATMGISRRIAAVPRGFVLGEDYVLLAHRLCIKVIRLLLWQQ
jgi:hypothetical protein